MYNSMELNLYMSEGEGENFYYLTAYGRDEHDQLDTQNYIAIEISEDDYKAFSDEDDSWYGAGVFEFPALLEMFIIYQLNKKAESK